MKKVTIDGNSAAANIAYSLNEFAFIYPITPSSNMSELCDNFNSEGKLNIFSNKLKVVEMQSEAGVAGAVHGSLLSGALTTTFTSSQGLLLMIPNMYKIAGELLPTTFFVASRAVSSHALNIFCDHSDIYATLKTGFNILSCANVQEVNDMAIASILASLKSSTPFICFFDGFRTSHELNTVYQTELDELKQIIDFDDIKRFKERAVSNLNPKVYGTNQNPDVFFQNRVASTSQYKNVLSDVKTAFAKQEIITKRHYDTIEFYGDPNATEIIVAMGSSTDVVKIAIDELNAKKRKTALIKIRLLKPFDEERFLSILPKTCKIISVLERNIDANGVDTITSYIMSILQKHNKKIQVLSGSLGLGGKEFNPDMAIAVFDNMLSKKSQKEKFTVGIKDDLTNTSLEVKPKYTEPSNNFKARIYGLGSDGSVSSAKSIIKILAKQDNSFAQGYFDYDSKKSGSMTISHIRMEKTPILKPFNSANCDIVLINHPSFINKYDLTSCLNEFGILLINCSLNEEELDDLLPTDFKENIIKKHIKLYTIDAYKIAKENGLNNKINMICALGFFKVSKIVDYSYALDELEHSIKTMFANKGDKIINCNLKALKDVDKNIKEIDTNKLTTQTHSVCQLDINPYYDDIIKPIMEKHGDEIPVSKFSKDGSMPTDTSKLEKRGITDELPEWIPEKCIQCGRCTLMCPHACLRPTLFDENKKVPKTFKSARAFITGNRYRIQVNPLDCTGCGVCSEVCPVKEKAIRMTTDSIHRQTEISNCEYEKTLDKVYPFPINTCKGVQFKQPYFEFSGACAGCGETAYIKLATQLFGDRMLIANATGCSSIYGATFPTSPYAKDKDGLGPSWANSLFEDNAEFGFGMSVALKQTRQNFINELKQAKLSSTIKKMITPFIEDNENHEYNRALTIKLNNYKKRYKIKAQDKIVFDNLRLIISPSIWIIGGDGWAYDIGFGGLDHIISTKENVNILILDTEVYSNTGGQASKSTPRGATAKFNITGKTTRKKDILSMAMTYKDVYCAHVAMGANPDQAVKAFAEAESYNGPSIILAYAPCINHGYDMRFSQNHSFESVKSGYNTLFRYDPRLNNPMQLDSFDPTMNYKEYVLKENRFALLKKVNSKNLDKLLQKSEQDSIDLRKSYKAKNDEFKN